MEGRYVVMKKKTSEKFGRNFEKKFRERFIQDADEIEKSLESKSDMVNDPEVTSQMLDNITDSLIQQGHWKED